MMRVAIAAALAISFITAQCSLLRAATTCVPARLSSTGYPVVLVQTRVNGRGPFTFFVDTGATVSIVSSALGTKLHLRELPAPVSGIGAGGRFSARAATVSIAIGDAIADHVMVGVIDFSQIQKAVGSADGLLGYNFLRAYRVTIDYPRNRLCLAQESAASRIGSDRPRVATRL